MFSCFLQAMFGVEVSPIEQHLFVLSLWLGGLRICNPVSLAPHFFSSSVIIVLNIALGLLLNLRYLKLDSYADHVSVNTLRYHQQLNFILMVYLATCLLHLTLCSNG